MTHQTRIKPDGTIVLPLAGTVKASNHTILTLADEIGKKMEKGGFLRNPIINVEVIQMVSQTATVLGKRSEEHTSELQSLMRTSYAVFCLIKNNLLNSTLTFL